MTDRETARDAPPARRDSQIQEQALTHEEPREILSQQDAGHPEAAPLMVLVLSSMPRSGSTLLTEMLSYIQDSLVLFEPLWLIEKTKCYEDEACVTRYLADVFSCSFSQEFEDWLKGKNLFFQFFNEQARLCLSKRAEEKVACLKGMNLRALCEAAPVVVVKVIRGRFAWLHNMLEDSLINLKVIHLIRDPRGSLNSIASFGWASNPHSRCSELEDDIKTYEKMRQVFPSKVMQVQFEHLCLAPEDTTRDIFRFLFGNGTLPAPVSTYLVRHMKMGAKRGGNMSTFRNSTEAFQAWRYKISERYLKTIEAEPSCLHSIQHMGHAVFGSRAAAKNTSLPLFTNTT